MPVHQGLELSPRTEKPCSHNTSDKDVVSQKPRHNHDFEANLLNFDNGHTQVTSHMLKTKQHSKHLRTADVPSACQWEGQQLFLLCRLPVLHCQDTQPGLQKCLQPAQFPEQGCSKPSSLHLPLQMTLLSRASWKVTSSSVPNKIPAAPMRGPEQPAVTTPWGAGTESDACCLSSSRPGKTCSAPSLPTFPGAFSWASLPTGSRHHCALRPLPQASMPIQALTHRTLSTVPAVHGSGVLQLCGAARTPLQQGPLLIGPVSAPSPPASNSAQYHWP